MPRAKRTPKPAAKTADGFSTNLLVRVSPELLARVDARVKQLQAERPGMSRSDFVREAVLRALREGGK